MKEKIKNMLDITFWKFVLVGIVNTLVGTGSFPNKRILETIHETPACVKGITIEYYIF